MSCRRGRSFAPALLVAAAVLPTNAAGQGPRGIRAASASGPAAPLSYSVLTARPLSFRPEPALDEGRAFLHSLIVPGMAQYRQGKRRWLLYAGAEVLSAFLYFDARGDARSARSAYRDFAWTRARLGISSEPRRDGDFEYYETLSKWIASGAWDVDMARQGVQPESDPATYNGWVWGLAMEIYNVDGSNPEGSPGYERALDFYRERGYGPPLLWMWGGGTAEQDEFREWIRESDRRAADARRALWILTANHLFSAIDGFITARLASMPPTGELGLVVAIPFR